MPKLTRRELYDLVWSTPMIKLAENFGISDVGLAKICDRHRVPTPPRGYWAKKEAGKPVKQAIFAQVDDPLLDRIEIVSGLDSVPAPVREIIEARRAERKAQQPKRGPAPMAPPTMESVTAPHPAVRATAIELRRAKPSSTGVVTAIGPGLCGISIGVKSVERIIFVLDALARACELRNLSLVPEEKRLAVATATDRVSFEITEKTKNVAHVLTEAEVAAQERQRKRNERPARGRSIWDVDEYSFSPLPPKFDIVRSGELGLRIFGWGDGLRYSWNDGKTQTLETLIEDIVEGFEVHLATNKVRREEQERKEAAREELARRRGLASARRERERERTRLLNKLIRTERKADELRKWLAMQAQTTSETGTDRDRMVAWTRERLTELEAILDPTKLAEELNARELFPEFDKLHDPLGEPPPEQRWF